jgi:hypothetical protein
MTGMTAVRTLVAHLVLRLSVEAAFTELRKKSEAGAISPVYVASVVVGQVGFVVLVGAFVLWVLTGKGPFLACLTFGLGGPRQRAVDLGARAVAEPTPDSR